jgi:integrase
VPVSPLVKNTLQEFLKAYPRKPYEPLFQNGDGKPLSKNTAHHWLEELICKIRKAQLPIMMDIRFGWHAFRRTYTSLYLERGGNVFDLKRNTGWTYTSTISHYLGDSKKTLPQNSLPLSPGRTT